MPTTVTGSPLAPFADAIFTRLSADAKLIALAPGGVYASLPESRRVDPTTSGAYVVVGHRALGPGAGAMQREGGSAAVMVDVWSAFNGPAEAQDIQSRIRALLQRADFPVTGFTLYAGSVSCDDEQCFQDFDRDMPQRTVYHGVQRWTGLIEEAI